MVRVYKGLDVHSDLQGQFPWASKFVSVGPGLRQAYVDEGPRDAKATFLLLHGNPTWGFLYRKFIPRLSRRFRVIVPDHVGFGRSDKPSDPKYYTLERHIQNLEIVLRAAKARHVVPVVHDWGGPIGAGWATRHPDEVAGFVVLNTWTFVTAPGGVKLPWVFKILVLGKGGWRRATRGNIFTEIFVIRGGSAKRAKEVQAGYRAPHPTPEDRVGIARFPQLIPQIDATSHESYAMMRRIEDNLSKISRKPALIVWAKKDPAFRKAQLDRWRSVFQDLDGPHLLPNAKHYLQEDAPDEILPRIEAWARAHFPQRAAVRAGRRKTKP